VEPFTLFACMDIHHTGGHQNNTKYTGCLLTSTGARVSDALVLLYKKVPVI